MSGTALAAGRAGPQASALRLTNPATLAARKNGHTQVLRVGPVLRHGLVILAIGLGTLGATLYLMPYALHRVVVATYDRFNAAPNSDGQVECEDEPLDFRLRRSTLTSETLAEIQTSLDEPVSDWAMISRSVAIVRSRLNGLDTAKPKAETADAETLYHQGHDLYCLCSEHAILLNEILQAMGGLSRVLWMEGHVTAEYFDRDQKKWVFVDPHMNLHFTNAKGQRLSAAELIHAVERDQTVVPLPICPDEESGHSPTFAEVDGLWYRNVLLNGRCHALSGTTLHDPSRWSHLVKYRERPSMLVLATEFNSAPTQFLEPFRFDKCLLMVLAFVMGFYALRRIAEDMPTYVLQTWDDKTPVGG